MSALDTKQKDLLLLVRRSTPDADGWYRVSKIVWPIINGGLPSDLAEIRPGSAEEGGGYLRLTERGQAVADYL